MARAASSTRPIEALYEAIQSLEAAALVCLATPKKRPVHRLRTFTRRIEAQLNLIALLPEIPRHAKHGTKVLALLKRLRRAAGHVRDLDVQRELIASEVTRIHGRSQQAAVMRKEAKALDKALKKRREQEAKKLVRLLRKERKKLPLAFEALRHALDPRKKTALSEEKIADLTREWFARSALEKQHKSAEDRDTLHDLRKRAKLARYMTESADTKTKPASAARRLATHFESIQQAGGHWHDWLQFADLARKELGKSAHLTQRFSARAARALTAYKRKLATAQQLATSN